MAENDAALNTALAAAQAEFQPIPKDRTVTVTTRDQGKYTFSYATLDAILAACRPALNQHGLALVQLLVYEEGLPTIRTELRHGEGGVLGASFPLPNVPSSPQQLGSLLTYLRRYALAALLGVAAEEDDDGRQASPEQAKQKRQPRKTAEQQSAASGQPEQPAEQAEAEPQEPEAIRRARVYQELTEALREADASKRAELPAGFDNWGDYMRGIARERFGTVSALELGADQLQQLLDTLKDELIPF